MANIVIKEILASDTVSDLVDKVNFNFDQLLLNGGGPSGPIGGSGPAGPLGPRGSIWFTANDIYNTSTTTTPDPPLVFPLWSGTAQKVNNIALPGYPQFSGDPNRYLPAAATVTGTYPENSFIIGTTGKVPRSGDLYLQETDDTFDSFASTDGDVWEFNGVSETWTYTGVNIKGDTGGTGATGFTEWVRTNDASPALNDFLRPEIITANDPVVRIVLGAGDAAQAADVITEGGVYTDNVLTLFSEAPTPGNPESYRSQISLTDEYSIQAPASSTYDYAKIYTVNNNLNLLGFNDASAGNDDWNVNVTARSGNVQLQSINPLLTITQTALLNTNTRRFEITNGALFVSIPPVTPSTSSPGGSIVTHTLTDTSVQLNIRHNSNLSSSYPSHWTIGSAGKGIRLLTTDQNTNASQTYLNLQGFNNGRVSIGYYGSGANVAVNGKLAINNGATFPSGLTPSVGTVPGLIIGHTWASSNSITFTDNNLDGELYVRGNSMFIQGQLSSARNISSPSELYVLGNASTNSINVFSSINMQQGMLGFNTYLNPSDSALSSTGSVDAGGNFFIGPGSWLSAYGASSFTDTSDLSNSIIIGGNVINQTTVNTNYNNAYISILTDTINQQVLLNSQLRFDSAGVTRMPNMISFGGAIIGKVRSRFGSSLYGHEDDIVNKNVIIGYPIGTAENSPRIVTTTAGSAVSSSTPNQTYISTPIFIGSMNFKQKQSSVISEALVATNTSKTSTGGNVYESYYPTYTSQVKIVHGKVVQGTPPLNLTSNPYNTGLGLELETRVSYIIHGTQVITRTPVVKDNTSYIQGNRPLLVTKRVISSYTAIGNTAVSLFEITPGGNTSIGSPLKFPEKSVISALASNKQVIPSGSYAVEGNTTLSTLNSNNAGRWYDITNGSSILIPQFNRSLHINDILGQFGLTNRQFDLDQNNAFIKSGVVINTGTYEEPGSLVGNVSNQYKNYINTIQPNTHAITTPVYTWRKNTTQYAAGFGYPLGMKPGWTVYDSSGPNSSLNVPAMVKGTDIVIEGGDFIYVDDSPNKAHYAGDIYISGGQIYKNTLDSSGYADARANLDFTDYGLFGNVYLGSRLSNPASSGYSDNGIMRAGLVYVGYDFQDSTNLYTTDQNYHPKGKASLNVSAAPASIESTRDSVWQRSDGRAINIQNGDIVTNDAISGWTTINLRSSTFLNQTFSGAYQVFNSENIYCYDGNTNKPAQFYAPPGNAAAHGVDPQWFIRYKVIGYTVHYIISLEGLRWGVTQGTNGQIIGISDDNFLFDSNPANSILPRPRVATNTDPYATVTGGFLPIPRSLTECFSGNGSLILRNNYGATTFPITTGGTGTIITTTPVNAVYDHTENRILIYKSGWSAFVGQPIAPSGSSTFWQDVNSLSFLGSTQNLIPLGGYYLESAASSLAPNGTAIFADIYVSGTYELDPASWFE